MKDWFIDKGSLFLTLTDGSICHPKSEELYRQKDNDSFVYAGINYEPLSKTNLRFSGLTAHVKPIFSYDDTLKLRLCLAHGASQYFVSVYANEFNDYIIYDDTWKYVDPIVESINTILKLNRITPDDITYQQYIFLLRELNKIGIEVTDDVVETVNNIKESVELEKPIGLNAELYPYQSGGSKWLDFMVRQKCGCILGDEMGLGKTLQIIA